MKEKSAIVIRSIAKVALLLCGIFLVLLGVYYTYRSIRFRPYKVRVSNVTDSAFTVSWVTDEPMVGVVYYGEKDTFLPGPLSWLGKKKAVDDRDVSEAQTECVSKFNKKVSKTRDENFTVDASGFDCHNVKVFKKGHYYTHHVTVGNLDADKEYFFRVGNGYISYKKGKTEGVKYIEREMPSISEFKQSTKPLITEVSSPKPAYGTSYNVYYTNDGGVGEKKNFDSLIFLRTFKSGDEYPLMSAVTNIDGGWSIDLSNVRNSDGKPLDMEDTYLEFIPQVDNARPGASGTTKFEALTFPLNLMGNNVDDLNNEKGEEAKLGARLKNLISGVLAYGYDDEDRVECWRIRDCQYGVYQNSCPSGYTPTKSECSKEPVSPPKPNPLCCTSGCTCHNRFARCPSGYTEYASQTACKKANEKETPKVSNNCCLYNATNNSCDCNKPCRGVNETEDQCNSKVAEANKKLKTCCKVIGVVKMKEPKCSCQDNQSPCPAGYDEYTSKDACEGSETNVSKGNCIGGEQFCNVYKVGGRPASQIFSLQCGHSCSPAEQGGNSTGLLSDTCEEGKGQCKRCYSEVDCSVLVKRADESCPAGFSDSYLDCGSKFDTSCNGGDDCVSVGGASFDKSLIDESKSSWFAYADFWQRHCYGATKKIFSGGCKSGCWLQYTNPDGSLCMYIPLKKGSASCSNPYCPYEEDHKIRYKITDREEVCDRVICDCPEGSSSLTVTKGQSCSSTPSSPNIASLSEVGNQRGMCIYTARGDTWVFDNAFINPDIAKYGACDETDTTGKCQFEAYKYEDCPSTLSRIPSSNDDSSNLCCYHQVAGIRRHVSNPKLGDVCCSLSGNSSVESCPESFGGSCKDILTTNEEFIGKNYMTCFKYNPKVNDCDQYYGFTDCNVYSGSNREVFSSYASCLGLFDLNKQASKDKCFKYQYVGLQGDVSLRPVRCTPVEGVSEEEDCSGVDYYWGDPSCGYLASTVLPQRESCYDKSSYKLVDCENCDSNGKNCWHENNVGHIQKERGFVTIPVVKEEGTYLMWVKEENHKEWIENCIEDSDPQVLEVSPVGHSGTIHYPKVPCPRVNFNYTPGVGLHDMSIYNYSLADEITKAGNDFKDVGANLGGAGNLAAGVAGIAAGGATTGTALLATTGGAGAAAGGITVAGAAGITLGIVAVGPAAGAGLHAYLHRETAYEACAVVSRGVVEYVIQPKYCSTERSTFEVESVPCECLGSRIEINKATAPIFDVNYYLKNDGTFEACAGNDCSSDGVKLDPSSKAPINISGQQQFCCNNNGPKPLSSCTIPKRVKWGNCIQVDTIPIIGSFTPRLVQEDLANLNMVTSKSESYESKLLKKTYAEEGEQQEYLLSDSGLYEVQLVGGQSAYLIREKDTKLIYYLERNGILGYQSPENAYRPKENEDLVVTESSLIISAKRKTSLRTLKLNKGINIVSFDYIPLFDESGKSFTSESLLRIANVGITNNISSISYFSGGQWHGGNTYDFKKREIKGLPFDIVPGKGYVVVAERDCTVSVPGYPLTSSVPIAFSSGWNLIGVHGHNTVYTAKSLINSVNSIEGLQANNVTYWPTSKGMYQGFQLSEGQEYGQDFPISKDLGYFVRINDFKALKDGCKSINWNPGGQKNGECN